MPKFKVFFTEKIDNLYSVTIDAEDEQDAENKFEDREYVSEDIRFEEEHGPCEYKHLSHIEELE